MQHGFVAVLPDPFDVKFLPCAPAPSSIEEIVLFTHKTCIARKHRPGSQAVRFIDIFRQKRSQRLSSSQKVVRGSILPLLLVKKQGCFPHMPNAFTPKSATPPGGKPARVEEVEAIVPLSSANRHSCTKSWPPIRSSGPVFGRTGADSGRECQQVLERGSWVACCFRKCSP